MVKRYDPEDWGGLHMTPRVDGCCVMFEDYEELRKAIEELVSVLPSDKHWFASHQLQKLKGVLKDECGRSCA